MSKKSSPATAVCDRCRFERPAAYIMNGVCESCRETRMQLAIMEQRAEFYDRALNTLVVKLRKITDYRWRIEVEHTEHAGVPRVGMKSVHTSAEDAELRFKTLVQTAYDAPGWTDVAPRWNTQVVDVRQVLLGNWSMPKES